MEISIIIPLYNKENCIIDTINSVLVQTCPSFELIVINDGSTDNSLEKVRTLSDSRLRIINKCNEGVSATRNRGVVEAKNDWLLFLDADDSLAPNCIELMQEQIVKYPLASVHTVNFVTDYPDGKKEVACSIKSGIVKDPFKYWLIKKWNTRLGAFIIRKDAFIRAGGFHNVMTIGEDTFFIWQLLKTETISYIDNVVMIYNQNNSDLSMKKYPFYRHIEYYMTLSKDYPYLRMIEAELLFKHFFRGLVRKDVMFSINLIRKFWKETFVIVYCSIMCQISKKENR